MDFKARRCISQHTDTARKRMADALVPLERIAVLKFLGRRVQYTYTRHLVISQAAWGWCLHAPPTYEQLAFTRSLQRAAMERTAIPLRRILRRHELDLGFMAGLGAVRHYFLACADEDVTRELAIRPHAYPRGCRDMARG
jgi:hypothetical protein